jgi:ubiquinone/menaquinone biosynthesis C-methylase UbiE
MSQPSQSYTDIKEYYGETLKSSDDLKTGACCTADSMPPPVRRALKNVHEEVIEKFYGCGSPIPFNLAGASVLDLGCGSGRDCYILSQIVGPEGFVTGIDMTEEQLSVANKHIGWHMDKFGFNEPNIEFKHGYIEDLKTAGIADNSMDLVVSNCVINLSPDKDRVFSEIFRVLKPGGELYFSDIFGNRRVPEALKSDPVLLGECLSGALYIEDFRRLLARHDCHDYRLVAQSDVPLLDPDIIAKLGMIDFYSLTIRAFKGNYEDRCEDYGQVAWYKGTIDHCPHSFILDDHHEFKTGQPMLVCGNTAQMLSGPRYKDHFRIDGDTSTHYGLFDCDPTPKESVGKALTAASCC